jgi:hypothetical protein
MSIKSSPVKCSIYRCSRQDEMYLYVHERLSLDEIPEELGKRTGRLDLVMELELTAGRSLAREDVNKVIANLLQQGFHLQMPPRPPQVALHFGG